MTKAVPSDFSLKYEWCEGSVPPPYHYEYTIRVGPGLRGQIVFLPGYPQHGPPAWTEDFQVTEAAVARLYELLAAAAVLERSWKRRAHAPVGGSLEWLEVTADGQTVSVPSMAEQAELLEEAYTAVKALVPERLWTKLLAQRQQYEQAFLQGHER